MVKNRVNHTDPVVQVRLRVVWGNLHGAYKKVYLATGFVCPRSYIKRTLLKGKEYYAKPSTA